MSDILSNADRAVHHEVVDAARGMERAGLVVGTAGNVSGRRTGGAVCLTPAATPYSEVAADSLAVLGLDGERLAGAANPSTEKAMHLACYNAFDEVGGVVHCHPPHASMFAVARLPIPACIEEVIVHVGGDVPVADYATTGTQELADEVVRHLSDRSAVLMASHGLLCVGKSPSDALHTALVVEHTAKIVFGAQILSGSPAVEPGTDKMLEASLQSGVRRLPASVVQRFAGVYARSRSTW